ncbi:hypothetical protein H2202_008515 [Exophiala xenobiotica]|nr:hypothetical protein H2202_008515 [Exophiala xenobiotica]KAK5206946.1 hypothetical protein LTR41_007481 [Exophiala xenobiotica]
MAASNAVTTYLITGANRGLGKGLVSAYLQKPDNVVIAAVRNPTDSTSLALQDLPKHPSSTLIIVKIESTSETDPALAMAELATKHNITTLDVVIANAGIAQIYPVVVDAKADDMIRHFQVNALGVVFLFQAVLPLLRQTSASASPNSTPQQQQRRPAKFVTMSTSAATIGNQEHVPVPNAAYGPSKAALNWITKKIHLENPDIIAFPLDPGWVQTDMGNAGAKAFGLEEAPLSVDESIHGIVHVVDHATRETSGKFMTYNGGEQAW